LGLLPDIEIFVLLNSPLSQAFLPFICSLINLLPVIENFAGNKTQYNIFEKT
jgi:hypothetical protein